MNGKLTLILMLLYLVIPVAAWSHPFGGPDFDTGYSVQETSDGGYIVAGTIYAFGDADVMLFKTDSSGNQMWFRIIGWAGEDHGYSVVQTTDGGYVVVGSEWRERWTDDCIESWCYPCMDTWCAQRVLLIKVDWEGNLLWHQSIFGSPDSLPPYRTLLRLGRSVQQTTDGGYVITGLTWGWDHMPSYAGGGDAWLIKVDSIGNLHEFIDLRRTLTFHIVDLGWLYKDFSWYSLISRCFRNRKSKIENFTTTSLIAALRAPCVDQSSVA